LTTPTITTKALKDQIMEDIQNDLTKLISKEITILQTEITDQLQTMSTTLRNDMNMKILDVLETMATLNQQFTDMMDHFPPNPNQMPAHKKPKGLGVIN